MKKMKPMDSEVLREQGHIMVDFIADYYKNLEDSPQDSLFFLKFRFGLFSLFWFIYKTNNIYLLDSFLLHVYNCNLAI